MIYGKMIILSDLFITKILILSCEDSTPLLNCDCAFLVNTVSIILFIILILTFFHFVLIVFLMAHCIDHI